MVANDTEQALARRRLLLRDSLGFLSLLAVTGLLFAVTLLLFHSFTAHRVELARRWADRGVRSMRDHHPEQAIVALRTALNHAPENRGYELLLAQALGDGGHTDESYAYFMTLWEGQPGSGFINLELARLAAKRGDRTAAVEFYRASIYGTWEGDGVVRRAQVRLELARYLIEARQLDAARMELLIAGGNSPESAEFDGMIAGLLDQAQDAGDAAKYYQKSVAAAPHDSAVLETAGRFAYRNGQFALAHRLLARAETARAERREPTDPELFTMRVNAARIQDLLPRSGLTTGENLRRVQTVRRIAKRRLDACVAEWKEDPPSAAAQALIVRWTEPTGVGNSAALRDPEVQAEAMRLVYDAELAAEEACSAATGDDALLLLAAKLATPATAVASETEPFSEPGLKH